MNWIHWERRCRTKTSKRDMMVQEQKHPVKSSKQSTFWRFKIQIVSKRQTSLQSSLFLVTKLHLIDFSDTGPCLGN